MEENTNKFWECLKIPAAMVVVLWLIHGFQLVTGMNLGQLGVYPRSWQGIIGIFTAPFIHDDLSHLLSNSVPLFALSGIIIYFYQSVAIRSMLMIYVLTGLAVWLLARPVYHIGASGVVYGLVAFIFWNGIFRRNVKSIVLALIVMFFYSGMFAGIVPNQKGISWESHLYGGLVGIFASFFYKSEIEEDEIEEAPSWANEVEDPNRPFFLPRDVFEQTKAERIAAEMERRRIEQERHRLEQERRRLEQERREARDRGSDGWVRDDTL